MLKHRIIPCLLLQDGGLVKTRCYRRPQYVGDPVNAIRIFNEKEVDELMVIDIEASRRGREPNYQLIEEIAGECFMPLCYGGGIRTVEQARRLFALGVEKVCLQSAALRNPAILTEMASSFGRQAVLFSLDIRSGWFGSRHAMDASSRRAVKRPWQQVLVEAVEAGAGEVLLTSVDREGTLSGVDARLIQEAAALVPVPLIATGGVGSMQDIREAVRAGASAVAAGAFFVFHGPHRAVLITYPRYRDLEVLLRES